MNQPSKQYPSSVSSRPHTRKSLLVRSGATLAALGVIAAWGYRFARPVYHAFMGDSAVGAEAAVEEGATKLPAGRSVDDVLRLCGAKTKTKFAPLCATVGIAYPPQRLRMLAFKEEKRLEIWGANRSGAFKHLATYPIKAASGTTGPKAREGDRQVPEGFYKLTTLNPISRFHVSIRVDYPNAADIAANPGVPVKDLGGDIYIHGNQVSIGCLAMGDAAIEEIFCLAAQTRNRDILILPVDPRKAAMPHSEQTFMQARYTKLSDTVKNMEKAAHRR